MLKWWTMYSAIIALPAQITLAKYRKIYCIKTCSIYQHNFDWSVICYSAIVDRYQQFRQNEQLFKDKERVQYLWPLVRVKTDGHDYIVLIRRANHLHLQLHMYVLYKVSEVSFGCCKLRDKLNIPYSTLTAQI